MTGAGVDAETHVIAYDFGNGSTAARVWWLLRHFGHDRVSLIDGGRGCCTRDRGAIGARREHGRSRRDWTQRKGARQAPARAPLSSDYFRPFAFAPASASFFFASIAAFCISVHGGVTLFMRA